MTNTAAPATVKNTRNYSTAWILSLLLGSLGIDRFYLGYVGLGVAKLLTGGGLGIWWLVDLILILTGSLRGVDGAVLEGYEKDKKVSWIVCGILGAVNVLGAVLFVLMAILWFSSPALMQAD
jgi:TM2 domain-containing membrane protein YozV